MSDWISFPNLGIEFEYNSVAFSIGEFDVEWKWILAVLGAALTIVLMFIYGRNFGLTKKATGWSVAVGGVFGLIGARMLAVPIFDAMYTYMMYQEGYEGMSYYFDDYFWKLIWRLDDGNISFYGGLILGALCIWAMCAICNRASKSRSWRFADIADAAALSLPLGQMTFAIGHIFSQTHFGHNSNSLFCVNGDIIQYKLRTAYYTGDGAKVGPYTKWLVGEPVSANYLWEILGCIVVFAVLSVCVKKRLFRGQLALSYIVLYGVFRAFAENEMFEGLDFYHVNVNLLLAISSAVIAAAVMVIIIWQCLEGRMKSISLYKDKRTNDGFEDTDLWQREYVADDAAAEPGRNGSVDGGESPENDADDGDGSKPAPAEDPAAPAEEAGEYSDMTNAGTEWVADGESKEQKTDPEKSAEEKKDGGNN